MRKIFCLAVLLVSMTVLVYSQIKESWVSFGAIFGNSWKKYPGSNELSYIGAPGVNIHPEVYIKSIPTPIFKG
jgi:hypothetical protein